jgi:hypothetical protein
MPIQKVNRVKRTVFSPTRRGDTKRKHSTTPLRTRFRHLTLFPLNNPLHLLQIMTESARRRMAHVRFGSEADIEARQSDVRFTPKSGHCLVLLGCPLCGTFRHSFDHLVGNREHAGRNREAKRLSGLEVDHQLELGRSQDRQVGGLLALENPTGVDAGLAIGIG